MALVGEMQYLTIGGSTYSLPSGGGGSVTSVGVSNATDGGLTVSGSPITSSGTITIGHSNVLSNAQTTQAVYPITIDKNGHISEYGTAVTIPGDEKVKRESIDDSSTTARPLIISFSTVSSSGTVTDKVYKDSSLSYTPSSKLLQVSNINLGSVSSPGQLKISNHIVTSLSSSTQYTLTLPNATGTIALTSDIPTVPSSTGSATTGITIADHSTSSIYGVSSSTTSVYGVSSSTTTASKVTVGSHSTDYGVTAAGSGSAALTFAMDTTDTKKLKITFSHTHTAPTLGSKVPTVTASDVTVPIKNADATTVPIKNVSATTIVTSATHSVTDNGHTHTI